MPAYEKRRPEVEALNLPELQIYRSAFRLRRKMLCEPGLPDEEIGAPLNCGTARMLAFADERNISLDGSCMVT